MGQLITHWNIWPSGKGVVLKIKRSRVRFSVMVMCRSVGRTSDVLASSGHRAVMGTWYTDTRLGE